MNGTMPATVNSSDGSGEMSEALGTTVCPRSAKCSRKRRRISAVCIFRIYSVLRDRSTEPVGSWCRPGQWSAMSEGGVRMMSSGGVRAAPSGQLDRVARRERCVQAGTRPQFGLTFGGGGPDVGTEVADRVGEVTQALGD